MSLYRRYIDVCLEHSLVGKVLVVHEDAEVEIVQPLLQSIVDTYTLTPRQEQHA